MARFDVKKNSQGEVVITVSEGDAKHIVRAMSGACAWHHMHTGDKTAAMFFSNMNVDLDFELSTIGVHVDGN